MRAQHLIKERIESLESSLDELEHGSPEWTDTITRLDELHQLYQQLKPEEDD
jgi:prefoldin subunit 5